ncbi:MAG: GSCFA domain-containing protein [Spirosomataceae bacterium]
MGSCFAEVIGSRLSDNKIPTLNNPFGTLFHPISITKLIRQSLTDAPPDENLYAEHQGTWFHYDFHSSLWGPSKEVLAERLIHTMRGVKEWLQKTDFLILTLGTAFGYRHLETDGIVANCHKMPGHLFRKELLSVEIITEEVEKVFRQINNRESKVNILLTVSPVRHIKDTLPLNAVSKSILRVVCHQLCESLPECHYFPAYELLLDDLRDYRFYKPDLIHPSETAEEYIFEKFAAACFEPALQQFLAEWKKIRAALAHRPLQPYTSAHRKFLENLLEKLQILSERVATAAEIESVQCRLNDFPASF